MKTVENPAMKRMEWKTVAHRTLDLVFLSVRSLKETPDVGDIGRDKRQDAGGDKGEESCRKSNQSGNVLLRVHRNLIQY
jgi:hypothetical protein